MMLKKRRNLKKKGSMEKMNRDWGDWKLRRGRIEEISCWMSDIVVVGDVRFGGKKPGNGEEDSELVGRWMKEREIVAVRLYFLTTRCQKELE